MSNKANAQKEKIKQESEIMDVIKNKRANALAERIVQGPMLWAPLQSVFLGLNGK